MGKIAIGTVFDGEHGGALGLALRGVVVELQDAKEDERARTHAFIGGKRETTEKSVESQKTEDTTTLSVKN